MGAPKKADWREERRKRAWTLKEEGWQQQNIAAALGVSEGAVSHWVKRGREGGIEALKAHPSTGVSPRLSAEQKAQIPELLAKGAEAYGFRGDVWTASRVAEVIKQTFGVRYHRDHVGKLMREAGWSRQKPVERASQRNEEALKIWSQERWPDIKKSRAGQGDHQRGAMKLGFICCRWQSAPGPHVGRRRFCGSN
jgi:transposase